MQVADSCLSQNTPVTAGLKWAPEIGLNIVISTTSMAPVGNVFPNRASASLPPDSLAPMMPEPMTVANRNADPKNSEPTRWPGEKYARHRLRFLTGPCGAGLLDDGAA